MRARAYRNTFFGWRPIGTALILLLATPWAESLFAEDHGGHPQGGVTSIDVYADGPNLHLLVASRSGAGPVALYYRRSEDGGETWSGPVRVGDGIPPPAGVHRGMDVQVAASGLRVIAVWQTKGAGSFRGGPMALAISADGGRTWRPGSNPADDGLKQGQGFIDIAADTEGNFHLVWLDPRGGAQGLRYARSTNGGMSWSKNQTLDAETCECCWNTITTAPGGAVAVLYRDKGPRDMACVRSVDGGSTWSKPVRVGEFNWDINACPHVGGGLALVPRRSSRLVHAMVWTGRTANQGIYHLTSLDGGATWGEPKRLGDSRSWHPDIAVSDGDELAVVWDAHTERGLTIFTATSKDGGKTWTEPHRLSKEGASASHPRIVSTQRGFRAFWTESADGKDAEWIGRSLSEAQEGVKREGQKRAGPISICWFSVTTRPTEGVESLLAGPIIGQAWRPPRRKGAKRKVMTKRWAATRGSPPCLERKRLR
jgi:hypothetical protein